MKNNFNPPFSLFREYVSQLMKYNKNFLIIGNQNAIIYKEVFPLIKNNRIWLGMANNNGMYYYVPEHYEYGSTYKFDKEKDGRKAIRVPSVCWFTNINNPRRNTPIDLYKRYSNEYPHYENYDAIDVAKVADIPMDYDGIMGVPVTFIYKYNPSQFEIIGFAHGDAGVALGLKPYDRKLKSINKGLRDGDLYYISKNGMPVIPYGRILIRKRNEK